jgi:sRNA-binding protein
VLQLCCPTYHVYRHPLLQTAAANAKAQEAQKAKAAAEEAMRRRVEEDRAEKEARAAAKAAARAAREQREAERAAKQVSRCLHSVQDDRCILHIQVLPRTALQVSLHGGSTIMLDNSVPERTSAVWPLAFLFEYVCGGPCMGCC